MCSVFWLFWLSCQNLPSNWLERLLRGSLTAASGWSPESPGRRVRMIGLLYCFIVLWCVFVLLLFPTLMAQYSLFVLKVSLNTNKPNQTVSRCVSIRVRVALGSGLRVWLGLGCWRTVLLCTGGYVLTWCLFNSNSFAKSARPSRSYALYRVSLRFFLFVCQFRGEYNR